MPEAFVSPIKHCVRSGLGISMVSYFSAKEELENNKLRGDEVAPEHSSISTFLTYNKDKWLSPFIDSMIPLIRSHAKNWD